MFDFIAKTSLFRLSWFMIVATEHFVPSQHSFKINFKIICYTQSYTM